MGKFRSPFLLSKFRFLLACFGSIIGTTWLPDFEHSNNSVCCLIGRRIVSLQRSELARRRQCMELKSVCHFRAHFLFRYVLSSCFQLAPVPVFLLWIRILFSIISCYFVALFTLQDNAGIVYLFEESLFPKSAAILLPIRGWCPYF